MTLYSKVGTFTTPTSAGNQTVSGIGFTPVAVIIWGIAGAGTGWASDSQFGMGFSAYNSAKSAFQQGATSAAGASGVTTTQEERRDAAVSFTLTQYSGGTPLVEGTITTMSSANGGEFIINWANVYPSGFMLNYLAIGGSDLKAGVLQWTQKTSTGTQAVTGLGFTPSCVMHMGNGQTSVPATGTYSAFQLGAMDSAGNQWSIYEQSNPEVGTSANTRQQFSNNTIIRNSSFNVLAQYSSMDSDGFTVNFTASDGNAPYVWSLCLSGPSLQVGLWSKTTGSNGSTDAITTTGTPVGIILATDSYTATGAAYEAGIRFGFGASDGTNNYAAGVTEKNGVTTTVTKKYEYSNQAIVVSDNDSGAADAVATLGSFVNGSFTATWGTNNAVATQICYVSLGVQNAIVSLTPISSAAAAQAPTIAEADCNIPALSPITSAVAPVAPALRGDANLPTLTPVSNSAASVAATIARADCNIPALTPISSTAAVISLSSLRISVGLTLSTIINTVAPITPSARADAIVPTLTPISSSASIISPTTVVSVAVLLAAITSTAVTINASVTQADAILAPLSPPGATTSVISPTLTISTALSLSPINVNSSTVALSSLRADAIIPSLTPITSTAATVGVTVSTGSFVHILLTPIGSNAGVIAPSLRSDAVLPTLTPVTSTAAPVTPLISTSVAIILATIGATAIAVGASVSRADSFIHVSPILSSASTFDVSVYVGALLSVLASEALVINILDTQNGLYLPESGQLFQYEQLSLNATLDRVIVVASDLINEIAALTPIEYILPETQISESVTLVDEEGNETDTSVLEKIWRPASIPEPATIIILETSDVEEI